MVYPSKQPLKGQYSLADYLSWPQEERWEIIDGVVYNMSPAPSIKHQSVAGKIYSRLERGLSGKSCRPFIASTDVLLSEHDIVQPDVFVVCDPTKITADNIQGAPDLVVEVLSPSTALKDLLEKKALYERCGVREYIVVDPLELYVESFRLVEDGRYDKGTIFGPQERLPLPVFGELDIKLWEVFEVEPPLGQGCV
ncbi:MAG: hypothetical protein FD130_2583 [Halothiobacillaceae bacterium]|nr:MAG: hypothetical protein FD130_2583 [Halothiobacillaceae bacterium]